MAQFYTLDDGAHVHALWAHNHPEEQPLPVTCGTPRVLWISVQNPGESWGPWSGAYPYNHGCRSEYDVHQLLNMCTDVGDVATLLYMWNEHV